MMGVKHYHSSNHEARVDGHSGKSFVMRGGELYRGESYVVTREGGAVLDVLHEGL